VPQPLSSTTGIPKNAPNVAFAISTADVVGYSRLMEANEAGTLAAFKSRRKDILDPLVTKHQGRGSRLLAMACWNASAVAVQCAVELQRVLRRPMI
jgi:class 3 adenylate cyclase